MTTKNPWKFEKFKELFSQVPRACVEVIIKTNQGILLTLRKNHGYHGQWHIPGGTVFFQESLEHAVKRVALDELGIEVSVGKLLGVIEHFSEQKERGFGYSLGIAYECTPLSTEIKVDDQAYEAKFFKKLPKNVLIEEKEFLHNHLRMK